MGAMVSLRSKGRAWFALALVIGLPFVQGCSNEGPAMAPVEGVVRYKGKPLAFGGVLFQPDSGFPAQGTIRPDGSFSLSTYEENDGAAIGRHRVQVSCYESQDPTRSQNSSGELMLGRSLIPEHYTNFATSGIEVEVKEDNDLVVIELTDK